jgi:two-component system sensor histidine kinase/response regulator
MKLLPQKPLSFQDRIKSIGLMGGVQAFLQKVQQLAKTGISGISPLRLLESIKMTGFTLAMEDYEKRKLSIFNQLNFFQLVTGIILPVAGLAYNHKLPALAWVVASMPAFISILVLWLNSRHYHHVALITYFILYPVATSIVYFSGINLGIELSFVLYGILSVFFLQDISQMLFAVGLSMVSYFVLAVLCKSYTYQLATANPFFYILNQLLSIAFIFYGLFLIKKENAGYQFSILQQKEEITNNENLLKNQTEELTELNALKNKLFSVIAHDLKSPMYALRNLFQNMQLYDLPADEIKKMVPEVVNELTYTTSLMENLLQWARSQMQADSVKPQLIDISGLMAEVSKLLRLQAEAKRIKVELKTEASACAFADKDMINLVLRNLLSNAIKFTPEKGVISVGVRKTDREVEVYVKDTGLGMTPEAIQKISLNNYYTSKGTSGESGTGLGLLLCKEFLTRNGGRLRIESVQGKGSIFTFNLPGSE